jgi:hypothetical protein
LAPAPLATANRPVLTQAVLCSFGGECRLVSRQCRPAVGPQG